MPNDIMALRRQRGLLTGNCLDSTSVSSVGAILESELNPCLRAVKG